MPRLVLEIGTEEIPPRFFASVLPQLHSDGEAMLERARLRLPQTQVKVYGTPRRLVLIADDIAERQAAAAREERGPPARVAFDADGAPTAAGAGFARRLGVAPDRLVVKDTDQGEYVFALIQEPEAPAREALADRLPDLITGLSFPKSMRWGAGSLRFARPIRWLLALVDDEVIEFELEGLRSDRLTRGHPILADGMFPVRHSAEYEEALKQRSVIVDPDERRAYIKQCVEAAAERDRARVVDGGLLQETTFLVEHPTAGLGRFDDAFLRLPRPVLVEEMQHVQSYFPLEDDKGDLLPRFIALRDGGDEHLDTVIAGWESVLRAKLIDARFFYEQDLKRPLADRVEDLRAVVFQEKLGTVYDKMERLRRVARAAAEQAGLGGDDAKLLDRAALLCKADLTTTMVGDLPTLQGLIGREYALAAGEQAPVADAIGEHHRPRFADDALPETTLGRLLAVADKLDTLAALFAIGLTPTGSADPFGLRREAYGLVNILSAAGQAPPGEQRFHLHISELTRHSLAALSSQVDLERSQDDTMAGLLAFLRERLTVYLREQGIRYDLVDAALAVGLDDISLAERRARALRELLPQPDFLPTVIAATRPMNISADFEGGEVQAGLFKEEAERELWQAYQQVLAEAETADLMDLFALFGRLRAPIDRYFDDVLVMHEDHKLRQNRLSMCWHISQLFRRLAEFSLVVQP